MDRLSVTVPSSISNALYEGSVRAGESSSSLVTAALAQFFRLPIQTLFEISGTQATGIHSGAVQVKQILEHGDFGLGTFAKNGAEMVILDGHVHRIERNGTVSQAPPDATVPFVVVTRFAAELDLEIEPMASLDVLAACCDACRLSDTTFHAFRLDGEFSHVRTRPMNSSRSDSLLIEAADVQVDFDFIDLFGTLIGIWSPAWASAFCMPGYHFCFLSDDRAQGGHLLGFSAGRLRLRTAELASFHLAFPENEAFLQAELSKAHQGGPIHAGSDGGWFSRSLHGGT